MKRWQGKLALVMLVAGVTLLPSAAHATAILWSGSGSDGLDPFGEHWEARNDRVAAGCVGCGSWGIPGLGSGTRPFTGPYTFTDFHISFSGLPSGVTLNAAPATSGFGYDETTRFSVSPFSADTSTLWVRFMFDDSVSFVAADPGTYLFPGRPFFVNVTFTGPINPDRLRFEAAWTTFVPEPTMTALLGLGLAAIGLVRRRR